MNYELLSGLFIIFDLDGTIFHGKAVWLDATVRFLDKMNIPVPNETELLKSLGLRLDVYIRNTLPVDADFVAARALFDDILHEAIVVRGELFPGVYDAVAELYADGCELAVCSNSPEMYIKTVLESSGLSSMISYYCSTESYDSKAEAMRAAARGDVPRFVHSEPRNRLSRPSRDTNMNESQQKLVLAIGDTHGDIEAARENGYISIAAMYGYGNKSMLASADYFANTPSDIVNCVRSAARDSNP